MASSRDGSRRPGIARPLPRRLFSIDSLRKEKSGSDSDVASTGRDGVQYTHAHAASDTSSIRAPRLREKTSEGRPSAIPEQVEGSTNWTEKVLVTSPEAVHASPLSYRAHTPRARGKAAASRPMPLNLNVEGAALTGEDAPVPSPSKMRWDTLRQHVLPSATSSVFSTTPRPSTPGSAGSSTPPPSRPSTPKSYRFGGQKKIFRQVVDQAREAAVEEYRKLSADILQACWIARFGQTSMRPKTEREMSQHTLGSSLHLPFKASATSLVMSPSVSSLNSSPGAQQSEVVVMDIRDVPSVHPLSRTLTYMIPNNRPPVLPHEPHVLSALLVPFLGPFTGERLAVEQQTAVETFEYMMRTWRAPSNEEELGRCLWCCNAASAPSASRVRILGALSSLLFSRDKTFTAETPMILRTLYQGLFSLLLCLASSGDSVAAESLRAYIAAVRDGQCGSSSPQSLEKEYGVRWTKNDSDTRVRHAIATESVIGCIETGSENSRKWMLHNLLEEFWPLPEDTLSPTPLDSCIKAHKLQLFANAATALLFSSAETNTGAQVADVAVISRVFHTRVLPEIHSIRNKDAGQTRHTVIRFALDLACTPSNPDREAFFTQLSAWLGDKQDWNIAVEETINELITNAEWTTILRLLPGVANVFPEELRSRTVTLILPLLHDRLIDNGPDHPCKPLTDFLDVISHAYPRLLYKPIFTCAASAKDLTIGTQLCVLTCLTKFLTDFWFHDADMVSVALMSDPAGAKSPPVQGAKWGRARTGQSVLLVELITALRAARHSQDLRTVRDHFSPLGDAFMWRAQVSTATRFVTAVEARLGALIQAKEQNTRIPVSQRILFCALFREIRLLTRSLKPTAWLSSVISWASYDPDREDNEDVYQEEEVGISLDKLRALYAHANEALRGGSKVTSLSISSYLRSLTVKRRTTAFVSPSLSIQRSASSADMSVSGFLSDRLELLDSLQGASVNTMFPLLVLVSGLLNQDHYAHLAPTLWSRCLSEASVVVGSSTTFLVMQCAEKAPAEIVRAIEHDLSHQDPEICLSAIKKMEMIASWRSHLLALDVILDRTYRRPFKVARPPIPFVPTDMGSSLFVLDEDVYEFKDNHGHVLPLELRRRLAEIGWDEEDRTIDPKTQWIKTPMSLLPSLHLESLDAPVDDMAGIGRASSPSPSPDPSPTASPSKEGPRLRRSSSDSSMRGSKRRPVFVPALVSLLPRLAAMDNDEDFEVANTARHFILDLMRDDPSLLSRSAYHSISGEESSLISATSLVMAFLHAQHALPPAMAHHLLNHLAGFLKSSASQQARAHPLQGYAYALPAIARLVTQVSKMSVRELRRAKVDTFLLPSGALWFAPSAPAGPLFPRGLDENQDPFESLPRPLVWITLIRTAQNMLFLRMLERDPQALKHIRKNLVRLELPSLDGDGHPGSLAFASFLPHKTRARKPDNAVLMALSLTLARSYLLLAAQIFWSMTRHLNDRQELAILVDGLNRVLLTHGDDIGVVGHALLAFMLASTRFKRMFISGGAYALFMPAIIKTYCEAEFHPGIRAAIEYAVNRFYALHQESFVFQSFDVVSRMFMSPDMDQPWLAKQVFALFSTLKNGTAPLAPDVAGIYDLTKLQEQENRMVAVAEEVPQTFLASLRRGGNGKRQVTLVLPEDYEWKRLGLDNLVRLFLTVIAHNPAIQRAERFMRSLRLLAPYLYNASSSSRTVLRDGIDALGAILVSRTAAKAKMPDTMQPRATDDFTYEVLVEGNSNESQPALSPADIVAMRLDYLSLVVAFAQAGGELGTAAPGRVVELTKIVLRDSIISADRVAAFLTDYMKASLLREPTPSLKEALALLNDFVPVVSAYSTSVNFSGVFDVLTSLCGNSVFANQPRFAQVVVAGYCRAGLEACEAAASESWLLSLPSRMSVIRLMNAAVTLVGADVLEELAKHPPSYDFLTGVVLPLTLSLKTAGELSTGNQWTESWHREAHSRAWARLLTYTLSACQNPHVPREQAEDRRKSSDSRLSGASSQKAAMSLTIALQILKVVVV
ncbi:hypothetical protein EVJ58_g7743, partial [Rhodofomes roseus]